jgi:5-methyltetrahydrofolate--homocysteine methyltransferase
MIPASLVERLPLLMDGRPGPWLRRQHPKVAEPIEALNLRRPDWVRAAHQAYFSGGARVLRTNTHAASAIALAAHGLEERCEAVNNSGAACVRETAGQRAVVLGAIGEIPAELGASEAERDRAYGQLAVYLSDLGCDALLLDEFLSVAECLKVLRLVRDAGDAPVLAALAVSPEGRAGADVPLAQAAAQLAEAGMDALGAVLGAGTILDAGAVAALRSAGLPLAILQHATPIPAAAGPGLDPGDFADRLAPYAEGGAVMLGGGAGATPEHIAALAKRLQRG